MLRVLIPAAVTVLIVLVAIVATAQSPSDKQVREAREQARQAVFESSGDAVRARSAAEIEAAGREMSRPYTIPPPRYSLPPTDDVTLSLPETQRGPGWSVAADGTQAPLLVLVSFGMPKPALRALAEQAARLGAPLVLRGLVSDSMTATTARIAEFKDIQGLSLGIDPTLFTRFEIDAVPAVILPLEPLLGCAPAECPVPRHVKLTGEAGLDYALSLIERTSTESGARQAAAELRNRLETRP